MKYVIEHMDPEMWEWSIIEYQHAAKDIGKYDLWITNVKKQDIKKIESFCTPNTQSVMKMKLDRVCVMDPNAEKTLTPDDADNFDYLIFGGILGNDPPEARTKEIEIPAALRRNLGNKQFSTDNALMVAKQIIDGTPLEELKFTHDLTIELDEGEEIILPYKYLVIKGKAYIADELLDYIKERGF